MILYWGPLGFDEVHQVDIQLPPIERCAWTYLGEQREPTDKEGGKLQYFN
jgi:hypothetical protein